MVLVVILTSSAVTYVAATQLLTKETADRVWKWAADRGHDVLRKDISLRSALSKLPMRLVQTVGTADVPSLVIDIKFKHLQKLREKRTDKRRHDLFLRNFHNTYFVCQRVEENKSQAGE